MLGALKFNSAKCETTCRLCLGRIKLLKNKRNMQMRQYRKDIAELLRTGKQDYARIRVEAVIREQLTLTAYEILELYLELLAVRASLVANSKEIPRDMVEALSSVLYAASRVPDLPELTTLHKMFMQKYGKEYVGEACSDVDCSRWMVNQNLRHCLTVEPPEPALKLETLSEIAQEFGVEWDMDRARRDLLGEGDHMMSLHAARTGISPPRSSGPIPGSSIMYQQQQQQQPIQTPMPQQQQQQGGYTDVAAAAAAAAAAAQQARSAADAAARFANAVGGSHSFPRGGGGGDDDSSNHGGGGGGGGGGAMLGAGNPLDGWLAGVAAGSGANTPTSAAAAAGPAAFGRPLQMQPLPGSPSHNDPAAAAAPKPGGYRVQSAESIQRAYDTAQGPPPKSTAAAAAGSGSSTSPPAAAAAAADNTPAVAAAAGRGASENSPNGEGVGQDGDMGLPGVPHAGGGGVSGTSSSTLSEYDELQKRFDALKKS